VGDRLGTARQAVASDELPDGLRWHDLRHTCSAFLIANGRHMEEVKEYLGHSSLRVTSDRYGHLFPQARAAMADALDKTFRAASKGSADFSRTSCAADGGCSRWGRGLLS
jgi:integrase